MKVYKKIILLFLLVFLIFNGAIALTIFTSTLIRKDALFLPEMKIAYAFYVDILDTVDAKKRTEFYSRMNSNPFVRISELEKSDSFKKTPFVFDFDSRTRPGIVYRIERIFNTGGLRPFIPVFILFLALLFATIFYTARILKPLSAIMDSMDHFGKGDFSARVTGKIKDHEIAVIANGFNSMADRIQKIKEKDQLLLRSISHELRNPVADTVFLYEILKEQNNFQRLPELGNSIFLLERTLNDIDIIANGILKGELPDKHRMELKSWIRSYIDETKIQMISPRREFIFHDSTNLEEVIVFGNEKYASVILKNLINNALQYGPADVPVEIWLEIRNSVATILFPVKGILSIDPSLLFHAFTRGRTANLRNPEGKGLGLAISSTLCETIEWKLEFEEKSFIIQCGKM